MKIYEEKENVTKKWVIRLFKDNEKILLCATDNSTEEFIVDLMCFYIDGKIHSSILSENTLKKKGYDPYEHNNKFDENGALVIN